MITKKTFFFFSLLFVSSFHLAFAQTPPKNWFNLDPDKDKFAGVSTERTYQDLLKGKSSQTIIVAVIDGGVDLTHEDLHANAWINTKEISGNGIDDDNNGYVDDINGWDFIGGKNGDVDHDNLEITRIYRDLKKKYENANVATLSSTDKKEYEKYLKIKDNYETRLADTKKQLALYSSLNNNIKEVVKEIGKDSITAEDVNNYNPADTNITGKMGKMILLGMLSSGYTVKDLVEELDGAVKQFQGNIDYAYNLDFDPRYIVGDNYNDANQRDYGNNDVKGPDGLHGTHVSGIIGAVRNNGIGMDGVADNVKIMGVRVVPDGDERDKDVANGIIYAVNNGAKVINMSFGKGYGTNKKAVDDAVKYAVDHDVLLVHAAGNDNKNNDKSDNFPNDTYADGSGKAPNWLEVGACNYNFTAAPFSNYGRKNVDLFAPGMFIYSTIPGNLYKNEQGTSMASPVAAGVAAVIRSYFPTLTAAQVKKILMKSVTKVPGKVSVPGDAATTVKFKKLCVTGGIINLYKAVELAQKMTSKN